MPRDPRDFRLKAADRRRLRSFLKDETKPQALSLRCRILLELDRLGSVREVARGLDVSRNTIHIWKKAYLEKGLGGLALDKARPKSYERSENALALAVSVATLRGFYLGKPPSAKDLAKRFKASEAKIKSAWKRLGLEREEGSDCPLAPALAGMESPETRDGRSVSAQPKEGDSKRVRIKDLAASLGLSPSTVSYALKGDSRLKLSTLQRVREAANEAGYKSDPSLSALVNLRWGNAPRDATIAYIKKSRDAFRVVDRGFLQGIRLRSEKLGYRVEEHFLEDYPSAESLCRVLHHRGVAGVVLGFIKRQDQDLIDDLQASVAERALPLVSCTPAARNVFRYRFPTLWIIDHSWFLIANAKLKRIGVVLEEGSPVLESGFRFLGRDSRYTASRSSAARTFIFNESEGREAFVKWATDNRVDLVIGHDRHYPWLRSLKKRPRFMSQRKSDREDREIAGWDLGFDSYGDIAMRYLDTQIRGRESGFLERPPDVEFLPLWLSGKSFPVDVNTKIVMRRREDR